MASGHANRANRPNTWLHRPTPANVKILLANSEPSTHGTEGTFHLRLPMSAHWARPDVPRTCPLPPSLTHLRHPATNKNPGLGFGNAHLLDCSFPVGNGF